MTRDRIMNPISPIRDAAEAATRCFHQCWYPLALSSEIEAGQVAGRDFLGTRVVVYRDPSGSVVVQNAWCPHLGADLSVGQLVDGQIRCAYHHWRFDAAGQCVLIPAGDKIPPGAKLATYPSAEAWGLVWAFNGETPSHALPRIPGAEEGELAIETYRVGPRGIDAWVGTSNAVDFQHVSALHGLKVLAPDTVSVDDYSMEFRVAAPGYTVHGRITGTNCSAQHLSIGGEDRFMMFCNCAVAAGKAMSYYVIGVRNGLSPTERPARLQIQKQFVDKLYAEDALVLDSIRFRRGVLVYSDRHLARFLKYVDQFPRAEPLGG
jgi:nitrite reductase/ring-hydroxylating ferredoxin subunit